MADEKIFTIPLRESFKKASARRVPYAARLVRSYVKTHTKAETVKLGSKLNEALWARSISKPPRNVRVKVMMDGTTAKAELMGHTYTDFKALPKKEKKDMKEKLLERMGPKALKKEEEDKSIDSGKTPEKATPAERHEVGETK